MNVFNCLFLASSLLFAYFGVSRSSADEEYGYVDKIDFISIEPIKHSIYSSRMTVKYSFRKATTSLASLTIRIVNSQYVRGKQIYIKSGFEQANTIVYDYPETYSTLTRSDVFIFELGGQANDSVSISSKVYEPQIMTIRNENETYETSPNIAIYRRDQGITYYSEKFIFTNLKQDYVLGKYWGVDLYSLMFNYVAPDFLPLTYDNPRLIIEGREGAFSKIGTETGIANWRFLSLTLDKDDKSGKYLFRPSDQLYVNPITLDMSSYPIENYIATKYLFFPRPTEDIETYTIRFMVDNLGANNSQLAYEFFVSITSDLYGNCNDSSYCLSMEDTVPNLDLGTVITH